MKKQLIISIGREFGSGGHEIAKRLADYYSLPLYDHNLLDEMAAEKGFSKTVIAEFDEKKSNPFTSRTVRGMSSSPEENVAQLQFSYIRQKGDSGESFVIVGRCSETVLEKNPNLIALFILGDKEAKIERISKLYHMSKSDAAELAQEKDRKRKRYHNSHCEGKWGDSRKYDLCINSSKLGIEETVHMIIQYIDARIAKTTRKEEA